MWLFDPTTDRKQYTVVLLFSSCYCNHQVLIKILHKYDNMHKYLKKTILKGNIILYLKLINNSAKVGILCVS
jgi:hypothetical protein